MNFTAGQEILARCSENGEMYHPAVVVAWHPATPRTLRVRWTSRRPDASDRETDIPRSWVFVPEQGRRRRRPRRYRPEPVRRRSPPPRRARPRARRRLFLLPRVRVEYEAGGAAFLHAFPQGPDYLRVVVVYSITGNGGLVPVAVEVGGQRYPVLSDSDVE